MCAENWRGTTHGMRFDLRLGGETVDIALPFAGTHFMHNFLAAAAAAHHLGLSPRSRSRRRRSSSAPGAHRGRVLRLRGAVTLLDDCYNSNPAGARGGGGRARRYRPARAAWRSSATCSSSAPARPELHRETGERLAGKLDVAVGGGRAARRRFSQGVRAAAGSKADTRSQPPPRRRTPSNEIVRDGDAVLVKGSRGVRMEAIVNALVAQRGRNEG